MLFKSIKNTYAQIFFTEILSSIFEKQIILCQNLENIFQYFSFKLL